MNKLKWTGRRGLITYINRGSPGDAEVVSTDEVEEIGRDGFTTKRGAYIPYHRVVEVKDDEGNVLLKRGPLADDVPPRGPPEGRRRRP